jgi:hypothetical protein
MQQDPRLASQIQGRIRSPDQHPVLSDDSALQQLTKIVKLAPTLSTPMLELIVAPNSPPTHLHSSTGTPHLQLMLLARIIALPGDPSHSRRDSLNFSCRFHICLFSSDYESVGGSSAQCALYRILRLVSLTHFISRTHAHVIAEVNNDALGFTSTYAPPLHVTIWYIISGVVCLTVSSTYPLSAHPKTVPPTSAQLTFSSLSLLRLVYNYFDNISSLGINTLVGIDYHVVQTIFEQHCTFSLDIPDKLATYSLH